MKTTDVTTDWKEIRCASLRVDDLRVLADCGVGRRSGCCSRGSCLGLLAGWIRKWCPRSWSGEFCRWRGWSYSPSAGAVVSAGGAFAGVRRAVSRWGRTAFCSTGSLIPGKLSAQRPGGPIQRCVACRPGARRAGQAFGRRRPCRCSLQVLFASGPSRRLRLSFLGCKGPGGKRLTERRGMPRRSSLGTPGELPLLPESVRYWGTDLLGPAGLPGRSGASRGGDSPGCRGRRGRPGRAGRGWV